MPLFQANVVKKYLAELPKENLDAAWQIFAQHFHHPQIQENIRAAKEEQYQEGYLRELFVAVFGYTLNPQPHYNLTTEYKNEKDSKKADGAVLKDGAVRAVIELKGTDTTDLSKIEKQAFGYLNNHKGCTYVITSNFEKLRFYIQDATDFEEFNLFILTRDRFALLYLCLHRDCLLAGLPLQVKQQSLVQEDVVTKTLYADYSAFKKDLFQNLLALNPQHDKLALFKKTQKLLDRFLFILFAEDRLLLPPNFILKIVDEHKQVRKLRLQQSLYERFKIYFTDLLQGNAAEDIFAYNGGLFEPDAVLDSLQVDDGILEKGIVQLSRYDYNTEVDVNILGHIFEHSLAEVEELQASLQNAAVDRTKTRRKKEGVFYTPRYITKYMVENTVGALCREKKEALQLAEADYAPDKRKRDKKAALRTLDDYRGWLLRLTICDPACGSGAFLNAALEFLIAEHRYVDELTNKLMGASLAFAWTPNDILEHNLFGVDINEEAVEIARLSLWLRTAQKGRKLSNLSGNIKVGNSLIDDKTVAGEKAFQWREEFAKVFANGGFDVVIGNPPYVFAREKVSKADKVFYAKEYYSAQYQVNTYLLFIELSIKLLNENGKYGLIVPNAWLMVSSAKNLREFVLSNSSVEQIVNLLGYSFENVNVETIILIGERTINENQLITVKENASQEFVTVNCKFQNEVIKEHDFALKVFANDLSEKISDKLRIEAEELGTIAFVKAGLQAYEVGKGNPKQSADDVRNRPYDYTYKYDDNTFRYLDGKDVNRYFLSWSNAWLQYGEYLAAPRTFDIFSGEKIIIREITGEYPKSIIANYSDETYLFNRSNIAVVGRPNSEFSLKYILSILNSTLISFYFMKNTPKAVRQMFPKVILQDLKKFPIKKASAEQQQPFIAKADIMLSKNKELQSLKTGLLDLLRSKYEGLTISKKLAGWPQLSFKEFLKELEKSKVKLSLPEQKEWLTYFENEKAKAAQLQTLLLQTDNEIDQMVYGLYGLTEEERTVVESSL